MTSITFNSALLSRYLIFYCPLNFFYKCVSFLPVKLIFVAMKEVVRVRKITAGVHHAHHHYHHGWFIMVIIGFVKGELLSFQHCDPMWYSEKVVEWQVSELLTCRLG